MKSAKQWAEEWSGTTVSSPEDVERFIERVQDDAIHSTFHAIAETNKLNSEPNK